MQSFNVLRFLVVGLVRFELTTPCSQAGAKKIPGEKVHLIDHFKLFALYLQL